MRITTQMLYSHFNYNLQNSMNDIYKTDEQIASGQKLNRPSDDPAAVSSITSEKAQLSTFAGYQDAIGSATLLLNATNSALDNLHTLISSAKQIGTNATSASAQDLATYSSMIDNVIQSTIGVANTKVGDKYIFSGYGTSQPAVDVTNHTLTATSTADLISMQINTGVSVNVNVTAGGLISSAAPLDNTTIIGAMMSLKNAIQTNNQAGIQTALTSLDNLSERVLSTQSDVGVRLNRIDMEKQYLTSRDTDVTNSVSDKLMLSTVDIARLSAESQQQQTALSSLRTITNSVLNTSLFDFLK
jgi:flagellar hook-associated protein 3 FlgL